MSLPTLPAITATLIAETQAEAVILYGSVAAGADPRAGDLDLMALRRGAATRQWCWFSDGVEVDTFLRDPDFADPAAEPWLIRLTGGRVLHDTDGVGAALLARVEAARALPPPRPDPEQVERDRLWAERTLRRLAHDGDPVRRAWLRAELVGQMAPLAAALRREWYLGGRQMLAHWAATAPLLYRALADALAPETDEAALSRLVALVFRPDQNL